MKIAKKVSLKVKNEDKVINKNTYRGVKKKIESFPIRKSSRFNKVNLKETLGLVVKHDESNASNNDVDLETNSVRSTVTARGLQEFIASESLLSKPPLSFNLVKRDILKYIPGNEISHCAMRMNSMSEKALQNRINAIARSSGRKGFAKLLIFFFALKLASLDDLANHAKEKIQIFQPFPTKGEDIII